MRIRRGFSYAHYGTYAHFAKYDLEKKCLPASNNDLRTELNCTTVNNWNLFVADWDGYIRVSVSEGGRSRLVVANEEFCTSHHAADGVPVGKDLIPALAEDVRKNAEATQIAAETAQHAQASADEVQAHFYRANLADRSKFTEGKYMGLDNSGTVIWIGESANHFYTDYIPVSEGDVICASFRFMTCFDADKALVASESINVEKIEYVYTVPSGVSYIVYSYYTDKIDTYMVNYGETLLPYVPYSKMLINTDCCFC